MMAATSRGIHRLEVARPWVFDDPLALVMVGPAWPEIRAEMAAAFGEDLLRTTAAMLLVRSRFAETRLDAGRFAQYVLLGAGLDSFAWRHPDRLAAGLSVFEVDHPASQAWKLARVAELGLPHRDRHVFAPVDFEVETVADGLDRVGFDWSKRTLFSWLGVVPYLTIEAIEATLRSLAKTPSGSEVVISYLIAEALMEDLGRLCLDRFGRLAADVGEPFKTAFTPGEAEALARRCGFTVADHPTRDDVAARYFTGRADGLAPITFEQLLVVAVV